MVKIRKGIGIAMYNYSLEITDEKRVTEAIDRIKVHKEIHFRNKHYARLITDALGMAIAALEKQIARKPSYGLFADDGEDEIIPYEAKCPVCGHEFEFGTWNNEENHHCVCGQKMDWR